MKWKDRIWFGLANRMEKMAYAMKDHASNKAQEKFFEDYDLTDGKENPHAVTKYNYYQGVNVLLLDRLIESGWVKPEDHLLDVGCGAGMFLFYMASKGYLHLQGQELDRKLYRLAEENKSRFLKAAENRRSAYDGEIYFQCGNALEMGVPEDVTAAYLFNPFYDQDTYEKWLACLKASLDKKPRQFTLILLYPTPASLSAIGRQNWLEEKDRFSTDTYVCSMCVHFRIYRN